MVPPFVPTAIVLEPNILQFVMILDVASAMKRMVLVKVIAETVVFEIVKLFPPVFNPLIVTLSAPLRSIIGDPAVVAAVIVRAAPPEGLMVRVAHVPAPIEIDAVPSVVLFTTSIIIFALACDVPIAVIAAPSVA